MNYYEEKKLDLVDEEASIRFGTQLAPCLNAPPLLFTFSGEIGSGKTTIIRAILQGFGVQSLVKSPTFSLVESYCCQDLLIHHFDLYRLSQEKELEDIGFRDYFSKQSICFIEWPEHAENTLPLADIEFHLSRKGVGRAMQIRALSTAGKKICLCLAGE